MGKLGQGAQGHTGKCLSKGLHTVCLNPEPGFSRKMRESPKLAMTYFQESQEISFSEIKPLTLDHLSMGKNPKYETGLMHKDLLCRITYL